MHEPLDLHEIAVLCLFEATSTEPRFRHAKLARILIDEPLEARWASARVWNALPSAPKRALFFEKGEGAGAADELDLPGNLLPASGSVQATTPPTTRELESIYYEARAHDGCYRSIALLQHFFDLYPPTHPLVIRTAASTDNNFVVTIADRIILEFVLGRPRQCTLSVLPGLELITGSGESMNHAAWGFATPGSEMVTHMLDLASMQFGDAGRGDGGELFRLGSIERWYDGIEMVAEDCRPLKAGAFRLGPTPNDAWLKVVAERVKLRWEARATKPWCGYCGKGEPPRKCACGAVYYCSPEHSTAGWGFHKRWCASSAKKKKNKPAARGRATGER